MPRLGVDNHFLCCQGAEIEDAGAIWARILRILFCLLVAAEFRIPGLNAEQRFQILNTDNGLPQNAVLGMRQAKDGYLWFTTYRGLVRFDGIHFQVFDESNTPEIRSTTFATFGLFEDHNGGLWAGTWGGGVIRYQHSVFTAFTKKDGLPDNIVLRVDEDSQGGIWFYTPSGLARYLNGKVQSVASASGETVAPYLTPPLSLGVDYHLFGLWRIRGRVVQRFAYGQWSDFPLPAGVTNPSTVQFESLLEDSQRRVWFNIAGQPGRSFCVENNRLTEYHGLPRGAFVNYRDQQRRLWITDDEGHTATWANGRATAVDPVSTSSTFRVIEDQEGGIWLGTINAGLARAVTSTIATVRLPGGLDENTIGPLAEGSAGDIWVGSYGLTRLNNGTSQTYLRPGVNRKIVQRPLALWVAPDGAVYCGYSDGLKIFRKGVFQDPDEPLKSIHSEVHAILGDHAGNLWVGSETGLFLYRNSNLKRFSDEDGLVGGVRAFHEDRDGKLWVGTEKVLCRYEGSFKCFGPKDGISAWRVRSIISDKNGIVWVAVAGRGVLRIAGDRFLWFGDKEGLYASDATAIVEDHEGHFWITCQQGIYRVRKEALNAFAEGLIEHVSSTRFGRLDGLDNPNSTGQGSPHGFLARDGKLWFPTQAGLARIDPSLAPYNSSPPPIEIESCLAEQQRLDCAHGVTLKPGMNNLEITYTALSLNRSHQIHFRYRLEGLDDKWVDVGTRRVAYFTHLPPGRYWFQVAGANSDGVWNQEGESIAIIVQPHFYQAIWFYLLSTAMVAGLLVFAWRARAGHFEERQALQRAFSQQIILSQEAERKRIAGELHDSLGQRLALIRSMAIMVSNGNAGDGSDFLQTIAGEASQGISEVRQISYDLRPHQLDLLGLGKATEVLAERFCQAAGVRAEIHVDDLSGAFPKNSEIHFYRIVQEFLSNVVKHSQAKSVLLTVQRTEKKVVFSVKDDGIGFVPGASRPSASSGGFGLFGIRERVDLLRGCLSVRSKPGVGTIATVEFSLDAEPGGGTNLPHNRGAQVNIEAPLDGDSRG